MKSYGNNYSEIIRIQQVGSADCFKSFFCGVNVMDDFIHNGLDLSVKNNYCKLYRVSLLDKAVALFALTFDSLYLDTDDKEDLIQFNTLNLSKDYSETFWSKRHYPAMEISYLAVAKDCRGSGLGSLLVAEIARRVISQTLGGCQFLTVEALACNKWGSDNNAVGFYLKQNFIPCEYPNPAKSTLRMFRPLYS